jgi:hypothetical protein
VPEVRRLRARSDQARVHRYSADGILHRVRWHWQVERGDRGFKVNNNWSAPLARWLVQRNPDAAAFFEMRESKTNAAPIRAYAD